MSECPACGLPDGPGHRCETSGERRDRYEVHMVTQPETSKCRACGRTLRWARAPLTGKKLPLSKVTNVYVVAPAGDGIDEAIPIRTVASIGEQIDLYISHFVDCTNPERFSSSNKKG